MNNMNYNGNNFKLKKILKFIIEKLVNINSDKKLRLKTACTKLNFQVLNSFLYIRANLILIVTIINSFILYNPCGLRKI